MFSSFFRWVPGAFQHPQADQTPLKTAFQRWINQTREHPTDALLLHDASGSVISRDFALGQQAASLLIDQFGPDTRIAVAQFASECTLECQLTDNKELVKARNQEMRQSGGDTKTELALQLAREVMSKGRPGAMKLVFLITDGHPDDDYEACLAAAELRRANVQIVGIGIGLVSLGKLSDICGRNSSFILPSYEALVEAVTGQSLYQYQYQHQRGLVPGQTADVSFYIEGPKTAIKLLEPYRLRIEVRNIGEKEVVEGSRLIIDGGAFFPSELCMIDKAIVPGDTRVLVAELKPRVDANVFALPEFLDLRIIHPKSNQPYTAQDSRYPIHLSDFVGDFLKWKPKVSEYSEANILVFGELGAGKSTLINSLISMFSRTFQDPAISLKDQEGHITQFLAPYETSNMRVKLIDSKGLEFRENEPESFVLDHILDGRYPFGKFFKDAAKEMSQSKETNKEENKEREIHACIVLLSKGFFSQFNEQQGCYNVLKRHIQTLVTHNLNPIVAVTHAEKMTESNIAQLAQTVEKYTGIHRDRVFCIDNNNPRSKGLAKEKVFYTLFQMALSSVDNHMKLVHDTTEQGPSRRRSPHIDRRPSSDFFHSMIPERVQYFSLLDRNTGLSSGVTAEITPDTDNLAKLRRILDSKVEGLGEYRFINVFSGGKIELATEKVAVIRCASKPDQMGILTVVIEGNGPPPYLAQS